ncbi:MAG: uroporphyrinogen-III C-methyltransferase, partial [Pseudomonadota bacterium]
VTPAIVDRDPVVVAIGTEGTAPVLTRQIKTLVEQALEPRLGELAALAGRLRRAAAAKLSPRQRRDFWRWAFDGPARRAFAAGKEREASRMIKAALEEGGSIGAGEGFVSLVGAGPGSRDLITLRGVQRLQEADIIFYDRLIDDGLLELARRDAERVFVGKRPGSTDWPQEKINGLIVAAARQGKRVVRLKCGDPGVFARGVQEADVLNKADIGWEIVPGVTAASAASAVIDGFLTERGKLDTLVLSTGQTAKDGCYPAWAHHLQPGVTLALYMAVSKAREIQKQLIASGVDLDLPVDVVSKAATADQTVLSTTIGQMVEDLEKSFIENPAVIFIRNRLTDGGRVPAPPATLNAVTLRAAQFPMFVHEGLPQVVNERR